MPLLEAMPLLWSGMLSLALFGNAMSRGRYLASLTAIIAALLLSLTGIPPWVQVCALAAVWLPANIGYIRWRKQKKHSKSAAYALTVDRKGDGSSGTVLLCGKYHTARPGCGFHHFPPRGIPVRVLKIEEDHCIICSFWD